MRDKLKSLLREGYRLIMPVYTEMYKDKMSGKMVEKEIGPNKQKQYYIRTYVIDEFGNQRQITRHNKEWIGREGKKNAEWEESKLKNQVYILDDQHNYKINSVNQGAITIKQLKELYLDFI